MGDHWVRLGIQRGAVCSLISKTRLRQTLSTEGGAEATEGSPCFLMNPGILAAFSLKLLRSPYDHLGLGNEAGLLEVSCVWVASLLFP